MKVTEEDIMELREITDALVDEVQRLTDARDKLFGEVQKLQERLDTPAPVPVQVVYQYYPYPNYPAYQPQYYINTTYQPPFVLSSSSQT